MSPMWENGTHGKELLEAAGLLPVRAVPLRAGLSVGAAACLLQMRQDHASRARLPHRHQLLQMRTDRPLRQRLLPTPSPLPYAFF